MQSLFKSKRRSVPLKTGEESRRRTLALRPQRLLQWEVEEDGRVVILRPKIRIQFLARHLEPRFKKPMYRIHLDDVGSFIWQRCDGRRTVEEILIEMQREFGERVEPAFERLTLFLSQLYQGRLIHYV